MKEVLLRMFFEEDATAAEVAQDLIGTRAPEPPGFRSSANYAVEPMTRIFRITSRHVVRIVDAMLQRELTSEDVGTIVFCMEASDRFVWDTDDPDGERVADSLFWLGTPEINYPLTDSVLRKIRLYLLTGEHTLVSTDLASDSTNAV